jgi:PAS domain S-box-containing protein
VCLVAAILIAGTLVYRVQEQQIQDSVTAELSSIALLKTEQIAAWRAERVGDAAVLSQNRFFIDSVQEYLASPDPAKQQKILALFGQLNASYHYRNILLVDPEGNIKASLDPSDTAISSGLGRALAGSFAAQNATLTDLSLSTGSRSPQMYAIAPLLVTDTGGTRVVGAVVMTIDPAVDLYPLIQSWPVPSQSAETLLVEREGDHVLYLNELRHQPNTALNLTIPLSQADLPAVAAVLGKTGPFTGRDYRGVNVISVLEPVPGSPWFMVAKIDTEEAYAPWRSRAVLIIALVAGTLIGAVVIIGLLWQRRQKYYYRSLYATEAAQRKEEEKNRDRLEVLLNLRGIESATGQELADFVLDAGCRLTDSTLAFIGMVSPDESVFDSTAWSKSAMIDHSFSASTIHLPIDGAGFWAEAVRQRKPIIVNDYAAPEPGKKGLPYGHVPVTRFTSVPIFDEQRIVMVCTVANKENDYTAVDVDNLTLLMQGVWTQIRKRMADEALRQKSTDLEAAFEEITATDEELRANYEELARNQQVLKKSEARLRRFYDSGLFGVIFWTVDGRITDANDTFLSMTGYSRVDLVAGKIDWGSMTPPEFRDLDEKSVAELKESGKNAVPFEKEYFRKDGSRLPILIAGAMLDEQRYDGVAFVLDISDLKSTRASLEESERKYRNLYHYAQVGLFETSFKDGRIVACNQRYADLAGFVSVEAAIGRDILPLYVNPEDRTEVGRILRETGFIENHTVKLRNQRTGKIFWGQFSARFNYEREVAEGTIIDITVQKEAEDALRESEKRLRESQAMAHLGFWYWDVKTGNVEWSDEVFRIFGLDPETFTPHIDSIQALSPWPGDHQRDRELIQRAMESHEAGTYEQRFLRPDNSTGYYYSTFQGRYDESGNLVLIVGTVMDITERKKVEESLRQSEEKYRVLFTRMVEGSALHEIIYDTNGNPVDTVSWM